MNEILSEAITKKLLNGLNEERITYIKIQFYIETMLSEIEKTIILLFLFRLIGEIKSLILIYVIAVLVRRYSGGNHCKSFVGCLFYSAITSLGIVILGRRLKGINWGILSAIILMHIVIMVLHAPIQSSFRPTLRKDDVIKIKVKGTVGILIISSIYSVFNEYYRRIIFWTLLFLLIDEIVACCLNYLKKMKGVIGNEESNS